MAVHVTRADLGAVADTTAAAFADDPVQNWLFEPAADPDGSRRRFFGFFVEEYFGLGHVHAIRSDGAITGAALWAPPDLDILHGPRLDELIAMMSSELGDQALPRLGELARTAEFRPAEPHFYLGILGVGPAHQGRGLGEVLVGPGLDACDRGGFTAHLESSNSRNIGFYERLGFVVVDDFRCGGPDGPLMTIMQRSPA